jgi:HRDC domain
MKPGTNFTLASYPESMNTREQQIGIGLVALGGLWFLTTVVGGDTGWLWVAAVGAAFLFAYNRTRNPGLLVPGGILAGVATGILLESLLPFEGSAFLIGLAGGFYSLKLLEPRIHAWAIYPASILTAVAGLIFVTQNALLIALVLIGAGAYLLTRTRTSSRTVSVTASTDPVARKRLALEKWVKSLSKLEGKPSAEILRSEQIAALSSLEPDSLEGLRGVLDDAQVERYGNQILEIIRA